MPFAAGISLGRDDLHVFVFGGDGDGFSIGGNHLVHTARKNVRITYVIMDNSVYGLTKNIGTFSPIRAAFHEYVAMWHDLKRTPRLRHKLGILFHGPGWSPPGLAPAEMESNTRG